ncbi:MAG: hypothetical protein ACRENE_04600 [Polyangiaceae bacterium]
MGSSLPPRVLPSLLDDHDEAASASGTQVTASARCCRCGHAIRDWRERLLPIATGRPLVTERGELALEVEHRARCPECGCDRAEIRVEETRVLRE